MCPSPGSEKECQESQSQHDDVISYEATDSYQQAYVFKLHLKADIECGWEASLYGTAWWITQMKTVSWQWHAQLIVYEQRWNEPHSLDTDIQMNLQQAFAGFFVGLVDIFVFTNHDGISVL